MNRRKMLGIISFLIIILLSVLFGENKHNFILGDFILTKMGISVWSNGNSGLHYTGVVTTILILLAIVGIIRFKGDVHKNFGKIVVMFFIVGAIIYQPAYDFVYGFVRSNLNGLQSIEYIRDGSKINFTNNSGSISVKGKITLKNYSNDKKEFYIKIPVREDFLSKKAQIIPVGNTMNELTKFIILPKEQVDLDINFSMQDQKPEWQSASLIPPEIIIYSDNEEIHEGKSSY